MLNYEYIYIYIYIYDTDLCKVTILTLLHSLDHYVIFTVMMLCNSI